MYIHHTHALELKTHIGTFCSYLLSVRILGGEVSWDNWNGLIAKCTFLPAPSHNRPYVPAAPFTKKYVVFSASLVSVSSSQPGNLNMGKDGHGTWQLPVFIRMVTVLQNRLYSVQLSPLLRRHLLFRAGLISCVSNSTQHWISLLWGFRSWRGGEGSVNGTPDR